ncbi:MAG TPA: type II toxin-antitoxin system VapC family toxin [Phycisphaerae bacterium]|nr:type II toxin-antitoxin system VapC family toxin [Phycisphaerae bacterium]
MIYVLDTDMMSIAELPHSDAYRALHARVAQLVPEDELVTTIVTYEEQTRGWMAYAANMRDVSGQIRAYEKLKRHLLKYRDFEVLDFDDAAGQHFERLRKLKIRSGSADLKIAATTLAVQGVLLTRNLRDFSRVPGLRAEDWAAL